MPIDRSQAQRFELKYLVSEQTATAVRRFVSCHLKPDEFAASVPGNAYSVHSLYLDSPNLSTYHAVQAGERNRFKLRIRFYANSDESVYFEIKRRTNEIVSKTRAKVRRDAVQPLFAGQPPRLADLTKPDAKNFAALQEFCQRMHSLRATSKSHVAYEREAWMSPVNNSMRVTFDRAVRCEPEFGCSLRTGLGTSVAPFSGQVVLELKFVDRLPNWCVEMVRAFGLLRSGAPKYAQGVLLLGEHRLSSRGAEFKLNPSAADSAGIHHHDAPALSGVLA
jgi:hypothetical protein